MLVNSERGRHLTENPTRRYLHVLFYENILTSQLLNPLNISTYKESDTACPIIHV